MIRRSKERDVNVDRSKKKTYLQEIMQQEKTWGHKEGENLTRTDLL